MGLWIVEPSPPHHVPGTVKLYEREDLSEAGPSTSEEVEGVSKEVGGSAIAESSHGLKRGSGADSHMFLVPQPSDSPNDPLVCNLAGDNHGDGTDGLRIGRCGKRI